MLTSHVEGSITLRGQSLTIGPNGGVRANVEARNVILHGQVDGNITASDRVELRKSASLKGDISTARIAIDDGAYFKGTIDIQKTEATKPEVKPQVMAAASGPRHVGFSSKHSVRGLSAFVARTQEGLSAKLGLPIRGEACSPSFSYSPLG